MTRLLRNLTVQVLIAVVLGVALGAMDPTLGKALKPLGDTFINLVKMVIAPIIFLTIVHGIASMADMRKLGRVGGKALLYFEVVSTIALGIGLVSVNLLQPGAGLDASTLPKGDVSKYMTAAQQQSMLEFFLHIIPSNIFAAFSSGDLLPVVFFAVLFGVALTKVGEAGREIADLLLRLQEVFFTVVSIVMKVAPIGAFGAMAYTVGAFGLKTLLPLGQLMLDVALTMLVFIAVVLGIICRIYGFRLLTFLRVIREELLLTLGTSSSEAALPKLMDTLERYGCARPVVGLVVPTGYSFNLDGTSIYLAMAALFIAQVYKIELPLSEQLALMLVLMLTSKGAAGVTGSGFIVLAGTLAATHTVPVEGVALLLGIDRFMSTARAMTNIIGNGVATLVVARSEGAFDDAKRAAVESAMRTAAA